MAYFWTKLGKALALVAGTITALLALLTLGLLALLAALCTPEWRNSQEIYLRNQTTAPLLLTLTVPRAALELDTAWWGCYPKTNFFYGQIACAQRLTDVNAPGLRYPTPAFLPALVRGTADTLTFLNNSPEASYMPRWDLEPWLTRLRQPPPTAQQLARAVSLTPPLATVLDSVQLTFALAPDSSFRVALRTQGLHHSDPDYIGGEYTVLHPTVQWVDQQGRRQRHPAPLATWLHAQDAAASLERGQNFHLIHYANYR